MSFTYSGSTALAWTPVCVAAVMVAIRIFVRMRMRNLGTEDVLMGLAWIFQLLNATFTQTTLFADVYAANYNLGSYLAEHCAASVFDALSLAASKSSVAKLFLRLIGYTSRWRRWSIIATLSVLLFATILEIIVTIVPPCSQAPSTWPVGACVPNSRLTTGFIQLWNFYSAGFDLFYSCLPLSFLYRVRLDMKEKLFIIVSLSMGWLAAVFAILRAVSYYAWGDGDKANSIIRVASVLEVALVIVCGCLPVLAVLINHWRAGTPLRPQAQITGGEGLVKDGFRVESKQSTNFIGHQSSQSTSADPIPLMVQRRIDIDVNFDHLV